MEEKIDEIRWAAIGYSLIGLFIALAIFTLLGGVPGVWSFLTLFYGAPCIVGLIGFYVCIWYMSRIVGIRIHLNKTVPRIAAILITYSSLILGTFTGSLIGYFFEGLDDSHGFRDYILVPILNVLVVGGIPALILALFLGRSIKEEIE